MKLLVLSDIHGRGAAMMHAVQDHPDAAAVFFLGDGIRDAEELQHSRLGIPIYLVRGNCDLGSYAPTEGLVPLGGALIFYTHGHLYNVKSGLGPLARQAKGAGADIALFGHTHRPLHEEWDGVHLFNPGALGSAAGSYGVVILGEGPARFQWDYV